MARTGNTIWVQQFKGVHDGVTPGADPHLTNDLRNVKFRNGFCIPRGGLTEYDGITTDAAAAIIGLFSYPLSTDTNKLLRMLPTALHVLNTGTSAWDDVTGTALTGTVTTRPQSAVMDDILVFTNEGEDRPRKYIGSGNSANIASGTAPFAKSIADYEGFLMLGNVSDDGTFTDVVDGYRMIRYSDDWDNDWDLCDGNEIVLVETPGNLLAMQKLGRSLICYKDDGIVKVTATFQKTKFTQELMPGDVGILAPLSLQTIRKHGHVMLGTDAVLYLVTLTSITPLTYEALFETLPTTITLDKLKYARSAVNADESIYYLFYDRTGLSNALLDSYVSYNFQTKEISKGRIGQNLIAACSHKLTKTSPVDVVVSSATDVYEFDSGVFDGAAVAVERYWTTGWQSNNAEGYFKGARLLFKLPDVAKARVQVSIASDLDESYKYEQMINLRGGSATAKTTRYHIGTDEFLEVWYKSPFPVDGAWFNLKVRFFADNAVSVPVELRRVGLEVEPKRPLRTRKPRREGEEV